MPVHHWDPLACDAVGEATAAVDYVRSSDGTRIGYHRTGTGPPLVLVHGTTGAHWSFRYLVPELIERFTVHALDRRGRGESGDAPDYTIEREFEDVACLVAEQFSQLALPVLLLLGGESPDWAREGTERIRAALPDARVAVLPGQGHAAIMTAPGLVADEITRFADEGEGVDERRPTLTGERVTIRPGEEGDVDALLAVLDEPSVARWWGEPESREDVLGKLSTSSSVVLLVVEVGGEVAGGIEYQEESTSEYRHAGIDVYLAERFQGRGLGAEAVRLLAQYLFDARGHHRLTIDPAVDNVRAVRAYEKVGFRPVGVMREYELRADGRFHDGLLMDLLRGELVG